MIAMMFEDWPRAEHKTDYLDIATRLRPSLDEIDGFISIERFESLVEPETILSLGFFRDEEAAIGWRHTVEHRRAQTLGRQRFFSAYRLRIAEVSRDCVMEDRRDAPKDSNCIHHRK